MADYRTERFYNRKPEFEMVERLLFSNKPSSERIVNFFGVSGSGKSWIINRLGENYRSKMPCFLSKKIEKMDSLALLNSIIQSLAKSLVGRLENLMQGYLTLPQQPSMEDIEDYLDKLLSYLEGQKQKILLLIDNYDTWSPKLQRKFEQCILNRMLEYKCGLAVLTSRAKISFEGLGLPALGLSMKPHELETFSDQIIADKYHEYRPVIPHILKMTGGLPLCVENVFDYLLEQQITTVSEFFKYEEHLVKTIYEKLIKERILTELKPELYETICVLSIPRRFNVGVLRCLLPEIIPSRYHKEDPNIDYLEVINDLGYFAPWNPSKNGLSIQKAIRQILLRYMKLFNPDIFGEVNKILLNMYKEKIDVPLPDMHEICEYLYYRLVGMRSEKTEKIPEQTINHEFSSYVVTYFKQYAKREGSIDKLNALKKTLETDDDINRYITKATWKILERTIRTSN